MKKKRGLGIGFVDELASITARSGHYKAQREADWKDALLPNYEPESDKSIKSWRPAILFCISVFSFFFIFLRLFHLQIAKGEENRNLAEGNRIQVKRIHAPRGVIYDRNGKILAANNPGFRLVENERVSYISRDEAIKMEVSGDPNFSNLEIDNIRDYSLKEITAHALGYVGEITAEELKLASFADYNQGDRIGRGGVEETYEQLLRGVDGGEVIEVDSSGKKVRSLRTINPIPGQSLTLSMDADLQKIAYDELGKTMATSGSCCGAVVAEDPRNGEVLALVSRPSFDPNNIGAALNSSNFPLLNRAISGLYPPGSVFKVASSLAGLSSGKITPETQFEDTGIMNLGEFTFANWYFTEYGRLEGSVNMIKAIQRSNDIYFYRLGIAVGENALADAAKKLGLGGKSNIDIPGESIGVVPDDSWKRKAMGEIWFPGDTLHMAIGQGFVTVTPIEISHMTSMVASGKEISPHLNSKISPKENKIDFKINDINLVKKGLETVPLNGGTAWPFFSFPFPTAGKTGTAEFGDPKNKTHAWYTSYAPVDDPKISITVLVEAGGEGSTVASPVAKEMYRWYFSPDKANLIKDSFIEATAAARTLGE